MKILLTQETDWFKRNPAQQHHLAEMLSLRGHDVRVIDYELLWKTRGKKELFSRREIFNDVSKIYSEAKVKVIRPGIIKIPWLEYVSLLFSHRREIARQIEEFKPDVTVGFGILNSYLAQESARKNNLPFIYYWIDVLHRLIPFKPFQLIAKIIESRTLKQANRVLVINDKLKDYVVKMGASPERTQVLRAGIDFEQFNPATKRNAVRNQYGIGENDIVLFFMGWLYRFSGLKEVASRLAELGNSKLKLLIVGEGDAYNKLQQIREGYNLQNSLILTGKKPYDEIPTFIAASDICLLPAYTTEKIMLDIVPIKMYEYMAMTKPVISTKLPGVMKEFGEDNGVVYVNSPEEVIKKAIELVNHGKLEELGARARQFVERYSWDSITNEFEAILEKAIEEKRSGTIPKRI